MMALFKPLSNHGNIRVAHGFPPVRGLVSSPQPPDEGQENQGADDDCYGVCVLHVMVIENLITIWQHAIHRFKNLGHDVVKKGVGVFLYGVEFVAKESRECPGNVFPWFGRVAFIDELSFDVAHV
jgi:hypothetical protein